jgi:ArsR family transcriptional regulator
MAIYLAISYYFEMIHTRKSSCSCSASHRRAPKVGIPEAIRKDLARIGGMEGLAQRLPPRDLIEQMSRVHHALSDPLRLTILHLVKDQPLCVCVINQFTGIAYPKLSYHLTILKEAGLIESDAQGNWMIYRITGAGARYLQA